jgi:hypothetical protein
MEVLHGEYMQDSQGKQKLMSILSARITMSSALQGLMFSAL